MNHCFKAVAGTPTKKFLIHLLVVVGFFLFLSSFAGYLESVPF